MRGSAFLDFSASPITNLCAYPNGIVHGGRWGGAGGTATATSVPITDHPEGLTFAHKREWTVAPTGTGGGYYNLRHRMLTAGRTYIHSVWVKPSKTLTIPLRTERYNVADSGGVNAGTVGSTTGVVCPGNVWTRLVTLAPAVVGGEYHVVTWYPLGLEVGDSIMATGAMSVEGTDLNQLPPYRDGNSPGWRWVGAANASDSVGYFTPNIIPDPYGSSGWAGGPGASPSVSRTDAAVVQGCPLPSLVVIGQFDTRISDAAKWGPSNIGEQWWIIEGFAACDPTTTGTLSLGVRHGNVYSNSPPLTNHHSAYTFLRPAIYRGVWRKFKALSRMILPDGAATKITPNFGVSSPDIGKWQLAEVTMRRALTSDLVDDGVLRALADEPDLIINGTGDADIPNATPTSARTLYTVHDILSVVSVGAARLGSEVAGGTRARFYYTVSTGVQPRVDYFNTSDTPTAGSLLGPSTIGRHVGVLQLGANNAVMRGMYDGSALSTNTVNSPSSFTSQRAYAYSITNQVAAVQTLVYNAEHDEPTIRKIAAWLARKYGAPVPAGY